MYYLVIGNVSNGIYAILHRNLYNVKYIFWYVHKSGAVHLNRAACILLL